ncbi:MAG: hypothetical protein VKM98_05375 [Cyanobacteriota bacterium]|nr:hypothetical protein [Cyanobacteriota bacterium]
MSAGTAQPPCHWDYKVVQLVAQAPPDADNASKKLGGALSAEALKEQFPEYYSQHNGRQQINDFLNRLGDDGWELVQIQQVADMPLMFLKRPRRQPADPAMATPEAAAAAGHRHELQR